ncbi:MAG TPA: hypothetical protein VEA99_14995 [Gemmatimonadaceae bacterium]|nr:hypothetical protein [Gemmatimonadaceae bacterium]
MRALLEERAAILEDYRDCYPATGGIGLVWLEPWDGATSLPLEKLDPYYVEICRRVRLGVRDGDTLYALTKPSERSVSRVDSDQMPGGRTGDPWVPLAVEKGIRVAYTAPKRPFRYDRLVSLIFPLSTDAHAATPARLQVPRQADDAGALRIVARVLVRDRMKTGTFGYHERHVAVTKSMRRMLGLNQVSDYAAHVAAERVKDASEIARRVLYPALLAVYTAAPSATERQRDDDTAKDRVRRALDRFDDAVDATFFADLDEELRHDGDATAQQAVRSRWLASLRERGHAVLESALASAPRAAMRHYRTQVRARARFGAAFARHFGERLAPPPTDDPTGDPA